MCTGPVSYTHLVGGWVRTTVSDNYILVSNNKQNPYKLFTRDGKYITCLLYTSRCV